VGHIPTGERPDLELEVVDALDARLYIDHQALLVPFPPVDIEPQKAEAIIDVSDQRSTRAEFQLEFGRKPVPEFVAQRFGSSLCAIP